MRGRKNKARIERPKELREIIKRVKESRQRRERVEPAGERQMDGAREQGSKREK